MSKKINTKPKIIKSVSFNKTNNVNNDLDDDNKKLKGGMKSVDDADQVDDDDYSTDNGDDDEVEEKEEKEEKEEIEKDVNSDDDLENKDEDDEEEEEENEEDDEEECEEVAEGGEDGDVDCVYRFTGKQKVKDTLELKTEDTFFEEDNTDNKKVSKFVDKDKRITKKFMTLYERVRLLGERAKQLSLGAKPMIKNVDNLGPKEIARLELEQKVMPLIVIRTLPNGLKEKWSVSELIIVN